MQKHVSTTTTITRIIILIIIIIILLLILLIIIFVVAAAAVVVVGALFHADFPDASGHYAFLNTGTTQLANYVNTTLYIGRSEVMFEFYVNITSQRRKKLT